MVFLKAYATNIVSLAGIVGAFSLFLGGVQETIDWFADNRELMIGVLIVHAGIFAIYWRLRKDARELERMRKDPIDDD